MSDQHIHDLSDFRKEYTRGGLRRKDLTENPLDLYTLWFKQACEAGISDPNAMCVATVDEQGQPYQRIVLLKHYDEKGFVFYTNLGSRKARQIKGNSRISLLFPWHMLERQVTILGHAEPISTLEVLKYFRSRPKESQIAAFASQQSTLLSTRGILEAKFLELKEKFNKGEIPLPSFWGGYRVYPQSIEFWQGGRYRLHDRFLYERQEEGWQVERLAP